MWIKRNLGERILEAVQHFPAVFLGGPRQAGKTSLLTHHFPGHRYVTLDVPSVAEQAERRPQELLSDSSPTIFDEIQYAPGFLRHVKVAIDARRTPGRFLLTGSQVLASMAQVSESLAGRCAVLDLATLSARELVDAGQLAEDSVELLLFRGGYPELWEKPDLPRDLWYSSYLATYLERDVRNLLNVGSLRDFERFLRALAGRTGNLLSYSELARDVGVAVSTVRDWTSVLVTSHVVTLLEPYHRSTGMRLVKSPKVYWNDAGFAAWLVGIQTPEQLRSSPLLGHLWENQVHGEIRRLLSVSAPGAALYFWSAHGRAEVDFLLDRGGRFELFECKWSASPGNEALKGFRTFRRAYGNEHVERATVVCTTPARYDLADGTEVVGLLGLDL